MNKKLVKTRIARMDTLEAMGCYCSCVECTKTNCSAGGSFQAIEGPQRIVIEHDKVLNKVSKY